MNRLKAKGERDGIKVEVEYIDGVILVDGDIDLYAEAELFTENPIAGTFYPGPQSMLNVHNNLKFHFFDNEDVHVEVEGELEEIPHEEGLIY